MLRDQGISYGDYIEQITYLLFLKMDHERVELLGEPSAIPPECNWAQLVRHDGEALERHYRRTLQALAKLDGRSAPSSASPEQALRAGRGSSAWLV